MVFMKASLMITELLGVIQSGQELQINVSDGIQNLLFLFQTECCGYSLESSLRDNFDEYPQHRV